MGAPTGRFFEDLYQRFEGRREMAMETRLKADNQNAQILLAPLYRPAFGTCLPNHKKGFEQRHPKG